MKTLQKIMVALLIATFISSPIYAQKNSSSRPSSSTPSSRPSSPPPSSRPSPSPPPYKYIPAPSSRPNVTPTPAPKPVEFSKPPTIPAPSSRPNVVKQEEKKPVVTPTIPAPSSRPNVVKQESVKPSDKPTVKFDAAASTAQKKQESAKVYQAATTPKSSYTTPTGTVVKVNPNDASVKTIRNNLDSDKYTNRSTRIEHHYHNHYGDRYDYYRSQPYVYVGGGYSTLFWYSMMDWSLERRAMWMYNNQNSINQQLYAQQLANNAQLRAEVEALRTRGTTINPHYVDSEYKENPDIMYDDKHIEAVYNPTPVVVHASTPVSGWTIFWILFVIIGLPSFIYLVFIHNWRTE